MLKFYILILVNILLYSDNIDSIINGYKKKSVSYSDDSVPLYQAETVDFPESPKHSALSGITVQLQVSICYQVINAITNLEAITLIYDCRKSIHMYYIYGMENKEIDYMLYKDNLG